jgi:PAS domain S-box-containing protein
MDTNGLVTLWNTRAEKLFGWTKDEMIGRELGKYIFPERYRKSYREGLKHYLKDGTGNFINNVTEISSVNRSLTEFPVELVWCL